MEPHIRSTIPSWKTLELRSRLRKLILGDAWNARKKGSAQGAQRVTYIVQLIAKDVNFLAVVVENVES